MLIALQLIEMIAETQILDVVVVVAVLHIGGAQHVTQMAQRLMICLVGAATRSAHVVRHVAAARRLVAISCDDGAKMSHNKIQIKVITLTLKHLIDVLLQARQQTIAKVLHLTIVEELGSLLHAVHVAAAILALLLQALTLQMLQMPDGHLDDFGLLDAATPLALVLRWYQAGQICQAGVHAIASTLLNNTMREWILLLAGEV